MIKIVFSFLVSMCVYVSLFSQEIAVGVIDKDYNSQTREVSIRYGIINFNPNSLYLMQITYYEMSGYNGEGIIFPVEGSLSGDAGVYAFRGEGIKEFSWDLKAQGRTWLGDGEFAFDLIEVSEMYSTRISKLYRKQNRVYEKLEQEGIPIRRKKRLKRKLNRITGRVNRGVERYNARR